MADELKKIDHVLLVVDGITATGIYDFSMEQQGIDVLIGASQKALMCPPGLAWVSMRQRAVERLKPNPRSLYLSIAKELGQQNEGKTAYTPAISLFWGLAEALSMIFSEGPQEVYRRHTELQSMARSRFSDLGFALYNEADCAARGLTAVCGRPGMDIKVWLKRLKKDYGLWLAGGQDELEGKIFRCAHMGYCYPKDLNEAFAVLEQSLEAK